MPTVGLILPTSSYRGPDFVAAAVELGVDLVIVTDGSLGLASGRIVRAIEADCGDAEAVAAALVAVASDHPLDAVVGVDDAGVVAAALAADRLDLPHNAIDAVAATRDKLMMRRLLDVGAVPQPAFREVGPTESAADAASVVGFPLVIKPLSLSGSRGVIKVDDLESLLPALDRLHSIQRAAGIQGQSVLVEEYLGGPEIAVEALIGGEGLEVLAVFDKPDPLDGPFFEETLYVTPSRHAPDLVAAAVDLVEAAAKAIGLAFGPVHAEVRLTADGPRMVELAARSIGGLCGRSLKFGMLAQSLEVLLLRAALGMNRRGMGPVERASGALMIPIPGDGVLAAVRRRQTISEVEGIEEISITVPIGRRIRPLPEGDRYLGFIIARGDTPSDVEAALREAHSLLDIEITPV